MPSRFRPDQDQMGALDGAWGRGVQRCHLLRVGYSCINVPAARNKPLSAWHEMLCWAESLRPLLPSMWSPEARAALILKAHRGL